MTVKKIWKCGDVEIVFRQVRRTLPGGKFPFRGRKGWTSATEIDCKLAIYNVSTKDGVGDINIIPLLQYFPEICLFFFDHFFTISKT